ncbi:MAG TPA: hypothetical protein VFE63_08430 [Roseiarcus sp.]|nr:hypothetical protein [Roseiarcus sp.]
MSESQRRAVNDWFGGTLYPRLNNKEKGAIVIVMQRLHEDDLVGHVMPTLRNLARIETLQNAWAGSAATSSRVRILRKDCASHHN